MTTIEEVERLARSYRAMEHPAAQEHALSALLSAVRRLAGSAPRPETVWTTTACPHCGGEVDGIRVLTEAQLARSALGEG